MPSLKQLTYWKRITGRKLTQEHKDKIKANNGKYWLGKKRGSPSKITRLKSSKTHKKLGTKPPTMSGKDNPGWKGGLPKCKICEKHLSCYKATYCSSHKGVCIKGDKNVNWKDGVTPLNEKARKSLEMKMWKQACLKRDNYTCQKYGTKRDNLRVHHINNFADYPGLRTSIENGITLSNKAHVLFHHIYGNKYNTREQLVQFLTLS